MLISALMPTRDRRRFIPQALACFQAQTWPEKELIILDDGEEPIHDLVCDVPHVLCFREERRAIPAKLNRLGEIARGEVFIRWDDDDWSDPGRMAEQAKRLNESGKAVTGYRSMLFWDGSRAWRYSRAAPFALGTSICCTREYWLSNRWDEQKAIASDVPWVQRAAAQGQLDCLEGRQMMVARAHPGNTSRKYLKPPSYVPAAVEELPAGFRQAEVIESDAEMQGVRRAHSFRLCAPAQLWPLCLRQTNHTGISVLNEKTPSSFLNACPPHFEQITLS